MPSAKPPIIFVVDDDVGLARLIRKALNREGFEAAAAHSGKDAVAWLTENSADLMLLDLKLPDMEGKELVSQLEAKKRNVPFIIITGQGDERVAVDMMKRGALDYVVKDVRFIDLVPTVARRALDQIDTNKRLTAAQAALEESKTQLLMVSEREQRRFGAELHDGLGQQLTAIELRCQALLGCLPPRRPDLEESLNEIAKYLREAVSQTRSMARGLAPVNLGSDGLPDALAELAARMSRGGRLECEFHYPEPIEFKDDLEPIHLFRIAQEAVNNAARHSGATKIEICLTRQDGAICLQVRDNGKGFPEKPQRDRGIGLEIMSHRASVIRADLKMESFPGKGVAIWCTIPERAA